MLLLNNSWVSDSFGSCGISVKFITKPLSFEIHLKLYQIPLGIINFLKSFGTPKITS